MEQQSDDLNSQEILAEVDESLSFSSLNIVAANHVHRVLTDAGSGARHDISIWRADLNHNPGYFSLGDVGIRNHHHAPTVFIISGSGDDLKPPADYHHIWSDHGSGAHMDFSFWKPIPQHGYTCLGSVG